MRSLWSWKKDREMLSTEKHEIAYVRRITKQLLKDLEYFNKEQNNKKGRKQLLYCHSVSKLRRICQYALKK